jgi:uncharacterized protein (TIGR03067 family)
MKRHCLTILTVALVLAVAYARGDSARTDDERLQGTWKVLSLVVNGEKIAVDKIQDSRLVIQGDKYSFRLGEMKLEMTYKADASKKPHTLDMTVTEGPMKGKTYHAIYALENGNLKICRHVEADQTRPSQFASPSGSGIMLIVWKRVTP